MRFLNRLYSLFQCKNTSARKNTKAKFVLLWHECGEVVSFGKRATTCSPLARVKRVPGRNCESLTTVFSPTKMCIPFKVLTP